MYHPIRPSFAKCLRRTTQNPTSWLAVTATLICVFALACTGSLRADTSRPLQRGVPVKLKLAQGISSRDAVGEPVALVVAEDVKDATGNVLIARDTPGAALISNSRASSLKNWFTLKRPQLEIASLKTKAVDGTDIELAFDSDSTNPAKKKKLRESTRELLFLNSDNPGILYLRNALHDPTKKALAENTISALASQGTMRDKMATLGKPEVRGFLQDVAGSFGLPNTAELFTERNVTLIKKLIAQASKTPEVDSANGNKLTNTEIAALALVFAGASKEIYNKVSAWIEHKNIRVVAETPIDGFVWLPANQPSVLIHSTTYDISDNPVRLTTDDTFNVWDYGYFQEASVPDSHTFKSFPRRVQLGTTFTASEMTSAVPDIVINQSTSVIPLPGSLTSTLNAHEAILQPAQGLVPGNVFYSVIRWTAPVDGTFDIDATFTGADTTPTTSDVFVLVDGSSHFHDQVTLFGATGAKTYQEPHLKLQKGQVVDFVVGPGTNNDAHNDATAVAAKISRVFQ